MADVFVDTSGWACWLVPGEHFNLEARRIASESIGRRDLLVTTNLVLIELTSLLTSPIRCPKPTQIEFVTDIYADPAVLVVPIDPGLEAEAWKLWRVRPDKNWTLVDCSSFVVMGRRNIHRALATDHHFDQAGFTRLLK